MLISITLPFKINIFIYFYNVKVFIINVKTAKYLKSDMGLFYLEKKIWIDFMLCRCLRTNKYINCQS